MALAEIAPVARLARVAPAGHTDYAGAVNAVVLFAQLLPSEAVRRLAALRENRFDVQPMREPSSRGALDIAESRERIIERWAGDLCGLLNAATRGELAALAHRLSLATDGKSAELRARLWDHGAVLERHGLASTELPPAIQPRPVLLGGHLVVQAAPRGVYPAAAAYPRALPAPAPAQPPADEPDNLDELLAAADRAIGVRLGRRGADKGAWGNRAATLLGVIERGTHEPDWRGDVEIKTVPVAREASGHWRIVEDPAITMFGDGAGATNALAKLQRTLWLARTDTGGGDATILSWYLVEYDPHVARLARRYLHTRPKGPAGTDQKGVYLSKRFFADAGFLATLNGPA
jgi:hypothetical protein